MELLRCVHYRHILISNISLLKERFLIVCFGDQFGLFDLLDLGENLRGDRLEENPLLFGLELLLPLKLLLLLLHHLELVSLEEELRRLALIVGLFHLKLGLFRLAVNHPGSHLLEVGNLVEVDALCLLVQLGERVVGPVVDETGIEFDSGCDLIVFFILCLIL